MSRICQGGKICDRTGLPHLKWKPATSGGKVVQFTTGDEREYPPGFCQAYAKCALKVLGESGTFVEVFSGPNAPLSRAVASELDEPLRGGKLQTERGIKQELQRISQIVEGPVQDPRPASKKDVPNKSWKQGQPTEHVGGW